MHLLIQMQVWLTRKYQSLPALFQPMGQGVLQALKRWYRKALLQILLLADHEGRSIIDFVKKEPCNDVSWEEGRVFVY